MSSEGDCSIVLVEPYFTRIGHNVEYSTNIYFGMKDRAPVCLILSSDKTTEDMAQRFASRNEGVLIRPHEFRYDGSVWKRFGMFLSAMWTVIREVSGKERRVLVLFAYEPAIIYSLRGLLHFRRVLLVDHSCEYPARPEWDIKSLYKFLGKYFVRGLSRDPRFRFVVHSRYHRDRMVSLIPEQAERVVEIEYGCTIHPLCPRPPSTTGERLVFLPGIWRRDKGIEFLFEHFPSELLVSGYRILLAGYPQEISPDVLMGIAEKRGIADKVQIIDRYLEPEHLHELYARVTYAVFPYLPHYSGGAGPVKDACGHGCPVLSSDAAGLGEIIREHGMGLSFRSGDPIDFVKIALEMEGIIRNGGLGVFSENATRYAESISWPRFAEKLLASCA